MSRYKWVAHERATIIGTTRGTQATAKARRLNLAIDHELATVKRKWTILPPENMVVSYQGLIVSIPHVIGRELIRRREAAILEHPVTVDVLIEATIEEFAEAAAA